MCGLLYLVEGLLDALDPEIEQVKLTIAPSAVGLDVVNIGPHSVQFILDPLNPRVCPLLAILDRVEVPAADDRYEREGANQHHFDRSPHPRMADQERAEYGLPSGLNMNRTRTIGRLVE